MAKMVETAPPIMDVALPSTVPPPDSARAVVVTNRPIMQDPMVTGTTSQPVAEATAGAPLLVITPKEHITKLPPSQKKKQIMPISTPTSIEVKTDVADEPGVVTKEAGAAADSIPDNDSTTAAAEPATADQAIEPARNAPADADESVSESAPAVNEKQLAVEAAQAAKVADLIKQERYVLPINALERRRSKQVVIGGFLLIVILAMAWLDLAADAGFIHMPGLPLTHFFRV